MTTNAGIIAAMPEEHPSVEPPTHELEAPLPRRGLERLDLLLLCVEALDLNGGEAMVWLSAQLGFSELFPNRVELWKRRCANPLRRATRRGQLQSAETDALIRILCAMAERLYPMLRQLLSSSEAEPVTAERWALFQGRLSDLVAERLNLRRGAVQRLLEPVDGPKLARQLVRSLSLTVGVGGFERLKASLLDAPA
jgi:hypothetical protein